MIYVLWLLMFGFFGGLCFLALGFLSGAMSWDFCLLVSCVCFIFMWLTGIHIEEIEEMK